jgi:trimeric autotransporter adhesin
MKKNRKNLVIALCAAATVLLAACGSSGDGDSPPPAPPGAPPTATTTDVSITVVDGAIRNALVCLDRNSNGVCDAGETQGTTDAAGKVTLAVPNADVGRYPILATIGTNAVDAAYGPITVPFSMTAPADQPAVVSPLTTLVQQTVALTGVSTAAAAQSVKDATGITVSLFQDFTTVPAPTDGSVDAAAVARVVVLATQQQQTAIAITLNTPAIDNKPITQADLDAAIRNKMLQLLPELVTALADPAVVAAITPAARDAALAAAAGGIVTASGLTPTSVPTVVAINTQNAGTPTTVAPPSAGFVLINLNFFDASSWFYRVNSWSLEQNTPDASNNIRSISRRIRNVGVNIAKWGGLNSGSPARNGDLHWNGSAWVGCPINFANTASVRDARGNNVYNNCDNGETGSSNRAAFSVAGKTLRTVYDEVRAAGFTNLVVADPSVLGTATFPAGSEVLYQTTTVLTYPFAYYPGSSSRPGTSTVVGQYSIAVSAGGDATTQGANVLCNSPETQGSGANSTTLEGMIAAMSGTPCRYGAGSFVYQGVTYQSGTPNEWWANSTVSIGTVGNAPVGSGPAPGYYTTNTRIRVAFQGTGTNPVTYYACKERFNNGSSRNCTAIGTGSYIITTLGDSRVMTLTNSPPQAAALGYNRVFVERGGVVYFGFQNKPGVFPSARLNTTAGNALLAQLGITPDDSSVPLTLTAGSYAGTWDLYGAVAPIIGMTEGTTLFINANGTTSCQDQSNNSPFACTVTITNPITGAFTYSDGTATAQGTFDFLAGTVTGTYQDPTETPPSGMLFGHRR